MRAAPRYVTPLRLGVVIGTVLLVAWSVLLVYVIDPAQRITPDLDRLYAAPGHQPLWWLSIGWAVAAILTSMAFAIWGITRTRSWVTNAGLAILALGGAAASSLLPAFVIGLGFMIDAENGGFYAGWSGGPNYFAVTVVSGFLAILVAALVVVVDLIRTL